MRYTAIWRAQKICSKKHRMHQVPLICFKGWIRSLSESLGSNLGLPVVVTNCSNNYGLVIFPKIDPFGYSECFKGKPLPVYGEGTQVRDWLFVEDMRELW